MDKKKIIVRKTLKKEVPINIRVSKKMSEWLREKNYSPTGIFLEACKDLGYSGDSLSEETKKKNE